jgi:ABC-2 type transport system ATP-binding protein
MKTKCMKDEVLDIEVADSPNWLEKILKVEGVKEAALFGVNIHAVVTDSARAIPAIRKMLEDSKAGKFSVSKILPSLEDVFVSSIEAYDKEHGGK